MFGVSAAMGSLISNPVMLIVFEIAFLVVTGLFIWIGAKIAQVRKASLARSVIVAVIIVIISSLIVLPFSGFAFFGLVISIFINIAVIKIVFSASWRRGLVTWVFSVISQILVFAVAAALILTFL